MSRNSANFEKLLEKATSRLQLEPDWASISQICDLIRQRDVHPKVALKAITKKTTNVNPDVVLNALLVLEACVKNCGTLIHDEIGTYQYMEKLRQVVKTSPYGNVESKTLELIQTWAHAFSNNHKYRAIEDTRNIMKTEGYQFPVLKDTSPECVNGIKCSRCHVVFNLVNEDNECSGCERVFCDDCSDTMDSLGTFGVEVIPPLCVLCYGQIVNPSRRKEGFLDSFFAQRQLESPDKTALELQEEEDLILALAQGQNTSKHKGKKKKQANSATKLNTSTIPRTTYSPPPGPEPGPSKLQEEKLDKLPKIAKTYEISKTLIYSFTDQTKPSAEAITDSESSTISELFALIKAVSDKVDKLEKDQKAVSGCKSCE